MLTTFGLETGEGYCANELMSLVQQPRSMVQIYTYVYIYIHMYIYMYIYIYCYHRSSVSLTFGFSSSELTKPGDQSMAGFDLSKKYYQKWWSKHGSTWFHQIINIKRGDQIVARVGVVSRWSRPGDLWVRKWRKTEWSNSWKNPGLLLTGLLIKLAILSKQTKNSREKNIKTSKKSKKCSKIQKIK